MPSKYITESFSGVAANDKWLETKIQDLVEHDRLEQLQKLVKNTAWISKKTRARAIGQAWAVATYRALSEPMRNWLESQSPLAGNIGWGTEKAIENSSYMLRRLYNYNPKMVEELSHKPHLACARQLLPGVLGQARGKEEEKLALYQRLWTEIQSQGSGETYVTGKARQIRISWLVAAVIGENLVGANWCLEICQPEDRKNMVCGAWLDTLRIHAGSEEVMLKMYTGLKVTNDEWKEWGRHLPKNERLMELIAETARQHLDHDLPQNEAEQGRPDGENQAKLRL